MSCHPRASTSYATVISAALRVQRRGASDQGLNTSQRCKNDLRIRRGCKEVFSGRDVR